MATLAEGVAQGAQDAQNQSGHTMGDALNAYHITATAEHARQELDMQKQKQDLNKATWVATQYDKIGRTAGPAQQLMIDQFGKQMAQIQPGFNTETLNVLKKDPELLRQIVGSSASLLSRGTINDPAKASELLAMHNGDLEAFMGSATKLGEETAKIQAAQLGVAQVKAQQLEEAKRQHALQFGEHAEQNKIIQLSKQNMNSLIRSEGILSDPTLPVTSKDLNLAYQDYSNAVAQGGAATEGQIHRDIPESVAKEINELVQKYAGSNQDLRESKAGKALIDQLRGRITNVKNDINGAIQRQGDVFHDIGVKSGNPYVTEQAKDILLRYNSERFNKLYGGKTAAAGAPHPTPYGSTVSEIKANYQAFQATQAHKTAGGK